PAIPQPRWRRAAGWVAGHPRAACARPRRRQPPEPPPGDGSPRPARPARAARGGEPRLRHRSAGPRRRSRPRRGRGAPAPARAARPRGTAWSAEAPATPRTPRAAGSTQGGGAWAHLYHPGGWMASLPLACYLHAQMQSRWDLLAPLRTRLADEQGTLVRQAAT